MATKKHERKHMLAEAFGIVVRVSRERSGLTQVKLAYRAGITPGYLSQIERGIKNATLPILWSLARVLEVKPSALVRDTEKEFRVEDLRETGRGRQRR